MSRKISLGTAIALIFVLMAVTVTVTLAISMGVYNNLIYDLPGRSSMYDVVSELDELVRSEFYGEINSDALNSSLASGYVAGLHDPNSRFMTAEEYIAYSDELQGKTYGIGARTAFNPDTKSIYVSHVFDDSPAHTSGLKRGDEIIEVDGKLATQQNYSELVSLLSGKKLSTVKLKYVRAKKETEVNVVKGNSGQSVFYEAVDETMLIRITEFYSTTAKQLTVALEATKKADSKSLILDLRGTSKGTLAYAMSALDLIVPLTSEEKAMATVISKDNKEITVFSSDANDFTLPMVVLINSDTAGPAELFATNLRDFGKAQLLGGTTRGIGTMQKVFQLKDGSAVLFSIGHVVPYRSEAFNGVGVKPDVELALSGEHYMRLEMLNTSDDTQLQGAINILTSNDKTRNTSGETRAPIQE